MGFSYRKSIKLMPGVRMTVSKSGVSYSAGGKGLRVTKTASGRVTRTVGIPGTGLSSTKSVSSTRSSSRKTPPPAPPRPPKPGLLASKGEKALYKAVEANDIPALERIVQEHPDHAVVAATVAALWHLRADDGARAMTLISWVLGTGQEPTTQPLYVKYVHAQFTLAVAPGVSVTLEPNRDALGLLLAELHQNAGDLDAAIAVVEGLEPTTITAVSLAELYSASERHDDVIDLTNGLVNDDDVTALLLTYRGRAFRALGQTIAAREALKEALKSKKRDTAIRHQALIERALTYVDEGKPAQARKDVERVMAEDRSHPDLAPLLALVEPTEA